MNEIDYSIIIPVYYNENCIEHTMNRLKSEVIVKNPQYQWEVIFIDDGSRDGSLQEILKIYYENPGNVKVIKFTRNFGQTSAMLAGYHKARGKCVITISADGQEPANIINDMLKHHFEEKFDIVICKRTGRDESLFRSFTSKIFYKLIKAITFPNMPEGGFDFVLLSRRAMETYVRNIDTYPFFQGQILWSGYNTKFLEYKRLKRIAGKSMWTFSKKLTYLIDGVIAYSFLPIRLTSLAGIILAMLGFIYALVVFFVKIFIGNPIYGWTPLMIIILVVSGFQMIMIGILGEYMWRTLDQVRQREPYVVDKTFE